MDGLTIQIGIPTLSLTSTVSANALVKVYVLGQSPSRNGVMSLTMSSDIQLTKEEEEEENNES